MTPSQDSASLPDPAVLEKYHAIDPELARRVLEQPIEAEGRAAETARRDLARLLLALRRTLPTSRSRAPPRLCRHLNLSAPVPPPKVGWYFWVIRIRIEAGSVEST